MNNTLKETINFQAKLGREYIKQTDFAREVNKLRKEEAQIQERISVKEASLGRTFARKKADIDTAVAKQKEQLTH